MHRVAGGLSDLGRHMVCVGLPLLLATIGVAAGAAFGQAPPVGEVPPLTSPGLAAGEVPSWVLAALSTGGFGVLLQLVRSGGIPLRHTVEFADRDRELLRDVRDILRDRRP